MIPGFNLLLSSEEIFPFIANRVSRVVTQAEPK